MRTILKSISYVSAVVLLFAGMLYLASCKKQEETPIENIQYVTTELGGCNLKSALKNDDPETKDDTVIITVSEKSVHVFVGLNYTCKTESFETRCETKGDIIYMYIIDAGGDYMRCKCYYTFDFVFEYQRELNQKYKIVLIDRDEKCVVILEGTMVEDDESLVFSYRLVVGGRLGGDATLKINAVATHYYANYHDMQTLERLTYQTTIKTSKEQWDYLTKMFDLETFTKIQDGPCGSCRDAVDEIFSVTIHGENYSFSNGYEDDHYKQMQDFFGTIKEQAKNFNNSKK